MTSDTPENAASDWVDVAGESGIDGRKFEQVPLLIIERYLDSFSVTGEMDDQVPQHILEALAVRFLRFFYGEPRLKTLDEAFGGKLARQRQARLAAHERFEIVQAVMCERERIRAMKKSERLQGTPHEIACEVVSRQFNLSTDNIRLIFRKSRAKARPVAG